MFSQCFDGTVSYVFCQVIVLGDDDELIDNVFVLVLRQCFGNRCSQLLVIRGNSIEQRLDELCWWGMGLGYGKCDWDVAGAGIIVGHEISQGFVRGCPVTGNQTGCRVLALLEVESRVTYEIKEKVEVSFLIRGESIGFWSCRGDGCRIVLADVVLCWLGCILRICGYTINGDKYGDREYKCNSRASAIIRIIIMMCGYWCLCHYYLADSTIL